MLVSRWKDISCIVSCMIIWLFIITNYYHCHLAFVLAEQTIQKQGWNELYEFTETTFWASRLSIDASFSKSWYFFIIWYTQIISLSRWNEISCIAVWSAFAGLSVERYAFYAEGKSVHLKFILLKSRFCFQKCYYIIVWYWCTFDMMALKGKSLLAIFSNRSEQQMFN